MNTQLSAFTRDLPLNTESAFKQDPKLAIAIDKLCYNQRQSMGTGIVLLPERKLEFSEVRKLLNETANENGWSYILKCNYVIMRIVPL